MKKSNEQNLGQAIQAFLKAYKLNEKFDETEIYARWEELVGSAINNKTKKVVLRGSVLSVYLNSSVLRQELNMRKSEMLDKVNLRLKSKPISEIEFK